MYLQRALLDPNFVNLIVEPNDRRLDLLIACDWIHNHRGVVRFPLEFTINPLTHVIGVDMANHTFIRYKLDETEKETCTIWSQNESEDLMSLIADTVADGNKFSVGFDRENGMYLATISNNQVGSKNRQKSITSRAPELSQAIAVALFKEFVIFERGEWQNHSANDDWG